MTSIIVRQGDTSTELASRLAVLPTVLGIVTVAVTVVGGYTVGVNASPAGLALLWIGSGLIAIAMATGVVVAHYLGLMALVVSTQVPAAATEGATEPLDQIGDQIQGGAAGGPVWPLALIAVWFLVVHEAGRLSLDARRPSRFGPGLLRRYALTTVAVSAGLVGVAAAGRAVAGWSLPPGLVPLGLAAVALPLVIGRWSQATPRAWRSTVAVRLSVGILVFGLSLGAVLTGAQARSDIINDRTPGASPTDRKSVV